MKQHRKNRLLPIVISKKFGKVEIWVERNLRSLKCHLFLTENRNVSNSIFKSQNFSLYDYYGINRLPRYQDLLNVRSDLCSKHLKYMIPKIGIGPVLYFDKNDILFFPETNYLIFQKQNFQ